MNLVELGRNGILEQCGLGLTFHLFLDFSIDELIASAKATYSSGLDEDNLCLNLYAW